MFPSVFWQDTGGLSAEYEKSSRFWMAFTLITVPAAAVFSGGLDWVIRR
jgi:hypothetical protein